MSTINPINPPPSSAPVGSDNGSSPSNDATAQALFDLGLLGLLSMQYNETTDPTEQAAILAQFNQIMSYFNVKTLTFSYNEGASKIQITDPTASSLISSMPTDISEFNTFWNKTTNSPVVAILQWMDTNQFNFAADNNPITQAAAMLFMISAGNTTAGSEAGSQFLSAQFLFDNSLISAEALSAFLANDSSLNPDVIAECLTGGNPTPAAQELSSIFLANYKQWIKNPIVPESEILQYESRYWPTYAEPSKQTINAAPMAPDHSTAQVNAALDPDQNDPANALTKQRNSNGQQLN